MSNPNLPADWYRDPRGGMRWWDGTQWTEKTTVGVPADQPIPDEPPRPWSEPRATPPASNVGDEKKPVKTGCGGCLGIAVVLGVLIVVGWIIAAVAGGGSHDPSTGEAIHYCEEQVDKQLKAPATAKYSLSATGSGNLFTVSGTVDAENSFGALIRNQVECSVRFDGDTVYTTVTRLE